MPMERRFACIGNSVNVAVVRALMGVLFDGQVGEGLG
jgi:hypothetical protein